MSVIKALRNKNIKTIIRENWSVSWAMTLIMFIIFLIGLADVYVAGKFGKEIQASYGISFQIYFVFLILAMALSVGMVSVVSRLFSSENGEKLKEAISSSLFIVFIIGAVFGVIGFFFADRIVSALSIPKDMKPHVASFLRIYSIGIIFHYVVFATNAILRACGMIRKSLLTMAIICFLNISLNFYLSFNTSLGYLGIATATVISLFAGNVLNLWHIFSFTKGISPFSSSIIKKITDISWPSGVLQLLWQLGAMVLFIILSKLPQHSIETIAAFTNGLKIESAIFLPAFAFNMANAVIVSNLLGKQEEENAFDSGIITAGLGVIIVSIMTFIVMLNARAIASILSNDTIVVSKCVQYIVISLLFEPVMAWGVILGGGLNGAGDTKSVMAIVALSIWIIRIPLSYLSAVWLGLGGIAVWWAMNMSILVQSIFLSKRYFSRKWITLARDTI